MSTLNQIGAVTGMNLRSLPNRLGTASVIVIGIAGVVAVLVCVLAMSTGLIRTLTNSGRDDRVIVMRTGSTSEVASVLLHDAGVTIADAPHVRHDAQGRALASPETLVMMTLARTDGVDANAALRGLMPVAFAVRPEIRIVQGRMFKPAVRELIVGRNARKLYRGLNVGSEVILRGTPWRVVGVFESHGDSHESELLADASTVGSAYQRGNSFSSMSVMLDSPQNFQAFKDSVTTNPALQVEVQHEGDFLKGQTDTLNKILAIVAYVVGGIMAIGAAFGALNAMYTAVSNRAREIATLRAIGFGSSAVIISVLVESLLLALLGALLGAGLAWLVFNGYSVSTRAGQLGTQLMFELAVTPALMVIGIIWACVIGTIGGLFPAIRAARLPVATALRAV